MDKKDIYEHLAKIYLDASLKRRKNKLHYHLSKNFIFISILALVSTLTFSLSTFLAKKQPKDSGIILVLQPDTAKINFNFDPAKKEIFAINLKGLNLAQYKTLTFFLKKSNYQDKISLRVEFTSAFREKSEIYLADIPHKWKNYELRLADFKNISNWSRMASLDFVVEEWNAKDKSDIVYIDNIRVLK